MARRFQGLEAGLAESVVLAERCTAFDLTRDLGYATQGPTTLDDPHPAAGVRGRVRRSLPTGQSPRGGGAPRLDEELRIIDRHGLAGFFVLHRDVLELAREVALEVRGERSARSLLPPGRGRGSSVSSIVCYFTGLSHVDPIANDLLLGRFLNEELTAFPDIDLDFPRDIREVLIPRIHERYGREHTALVATHPGFRPAARSGSSAWRSGSPPRRCARVAQASDGWSIDGLEQDVDLALGSGRHAEGRWAWLCRLAPRGTRAAPSLGAAPRGMIIATEPVSGCCPIVPTAMEGRQVLQWDKTPAVMPGS